MSTNISQFHHCSVRVSVPACLLLSGVHFSMLPSFPLRYCTFSRNQTPRLFPPCSLSIRKDTSLMSKALRELSGASNLKDKRVGHYLVTWTLSWPLARRQFNNAVQYMKSAISAHTTREACKAAVEGGRQWGKRQPSDDVGGLE